MSRNPLGSTGMGDLFEALCRTHLQHLHLANCNLDALCAKGLAFLLDNSVVLQDVDLSWNRIGPDGTRVICEALQYNQSLVSIDLGYNALGTVGGAYLGEVLCDNRCGTTSQP
jgi:Ran GTPase-activating protein (RanGAP) involved in mRNA processing and transport